jgi:hypothetical protein
MTKSDEEIDKILTTLRKTLEKKSQDDDDEEGGGCIYYEGVWECLGRVRDALGIPETDKSEYKDPLPNGEIGTWTQWVKEKNSLDNDLSFSVDVFDHLYHVREFYGGTFWSPDYEGARKKVAEMIGDLTVDQVQFIPMGKDKEDNPYGVISIKPNSGTGIESYIPDQ